MILRQVDLYFKNYRSDKEYHLVLEQVGSQYRVTAKFGPRGGTLTHVDKTKGPTTYFSALNMFNKTEAEKRGKGYNDIQPSLVQFLKDHCSVYSLTSYEWNKIARAAQEYIDTYVE